MMTLNHKKADKHIQRMPEDAFHMIDMGLDDLTLSPNETFTGKNIGRALLYASETVNNESSLLKDLIEPADIIQNEKYMIGQYETPPVYLYRFDKCLIGNRHGVIIRDDISGFYGPSARFLNFRPVFGRERPNQEFIELPSQIVDEAIHIPTALIFHSAAVNNYYHWHVETLPLLVALRDKIVTGDIVPVWARRPNKFQTSSLQAIGLEKAVKTIQSPLLSVDCAYWCSSLRSFPYSRFTPFIADAFQYIKKNHQLKSMTNLKSMPKKLQIIRPGQGRRPLVNEKHLTQALSPYDCVPIDPGSLSYSEQIQLFSNAEIVVGQHGGALTNMGFCQPNTKLLEIVGEHYVNPCFWGIAHISKLLYSATQTKTIDRDKLRDKNAPSLIDIEKTVSVYKSLQIL